jgi:hypothetical protein
MDLRFAKWEVRRKQSNLYSSKLIKLKNGKQGDMKSLAEANEENAARAAQEAK